jgi:iron complex outermembrane receptor protein
LQTSVGIGRYTDNTMLTLSYGVQDGKYGVPSAPEDDHDDADHEHHHGHENVRIDWRRHNVRVTGGLRRLGGWIDNVRLTMNYSDWKHNELEGDAIGTRFFNQQWTWDGLARQKKSGPLTGSFGAWGLRRSFKTIGEEALAPPVDQTAFALFSVQELDFERVRLQFGGRLEQNRYSPAGLRNRTFTGLSGSAGIYVPLWKNGAAVLNYTSSYRAPALEELYNRGPHLGNLVFEVGNPDLRRERGHGLELSLRHSGNRVRAEISGFYNRMRDFVYLALTGQIEDGLVEADYAQADARYLGADAQLDVALVRDLWMNFGLDVVDAQLRESRLPLPRIPPVRGRIGLDWRRGALNIRPELLLANRQWQIFPTEDPTAGYAVANLVATYTLARQHSSHLFGVNFFNAGDRLYRNHLSFIKAFAPEIGRGIRFSYTMNFF